MSKPQSPAKSPTPVIGKETPAATPLGEMNEDDFDSVPAAKGNEKTAKANEKQAEAFLAENKKKSPVLADSSTDGDGKSIKSEQLSKPATGSSPTSTGGATTVSDKVEVAKTEAPKTIAELAAREKAEKELNATAIKSAVPAKPTADVGSNEIVEIQQELVLSEVTTSDVNTKPVEQSASTQQQTPSEPAEQEAPVENTDTTAELPVMDEQEEQAIDDVIKFPVDNSMDAEIDDLAENYADDLASSLDGGSGLDTPPNNHLDIADTSKAVYIVLSLAALGISVRGVFGSERFNNIFEGTGTTESVIELRARLPKQLPFGVKAYIRSLKSFVARVRGGFYSLNFAIMVAPTDKRLKTISNVETAYTDKVIVDLIDYIDAGGDLETLAQHDIIILFNSNTGSPLNFLPIGDANIPNFVWVANSLDLIAPSLDAMSKYVMWLAKSNVPITLDMVDVYSATPTSIYLTETDDEDNAVGQFCTVFEEHYSISLMEINKPLSAMINPLMLGNKLLGHANTVGEESTNRFEWVNVSLLDNNTNWTFIGGTEYSLDVSFKQSSTINPIEEEDEYDEDEDEVEDDE